MAQSSPRSLDLVGRLTKLLRKSADTPPAQLASPPPAASAADHDIRDFGATLDGSSDDIPRLDAAYNATPSGGVIAVPSGRWPPGYVPPSTPGKAVHWHLLGTLDQGGALTGTLPVTSIGDNDLLSGYWYGTYNFVRSYSHQEVQAASPELGPGSLRVVINNNNPGLNRWQVMSGLEVIANAGQAATGLTWGINALLNSQSHHDMTNQEVGIASTVLKSGTSSTWQYFGQTTDTSGLPVDAWSMTGFEMDLTANGPEPLVEWNSLAGGRTFFFAQGSAYDPPAWMSGHTYKKGATIQPTKANGFTYICQEDGVSGTTEPAWSGPGGTTIDGKLHWIVGTTVHCQFSRVFEVYGRPNTSFGAILVAQCDVENAVIDATPTRLLNAGSAVLRMRAGQQIDFSADGSKASQNLRTISYQLTPHALVYAIHGKPILQITDLGETVLSGPVRSEAGIGTWGRAAPMKCPVVSGSISSGAALKSLIQALAEYGLVQDATSP